MQVDLINVIRLMCLCLRRSFDDATGINFRFRPLVTWSSPHGRDASSQNLVQISLSSPELLTISEIQDGGRRHLGFSGYENLAFPTC